MNPFDDLMSRIRATPPEEYESAADSDETTGEIIGEITDPLMKQITYHYTKLGTRLGELSEALEQAGEDAPPRLLFEARASHMEFNVVAAVLSLLTEKVFGQALTSEERAEGWNWVVRRGWLLWKAPPDASDDEDQPEAELSTGESKKKPLLM